MSSQGWIKVNRSIFQHWIYNHEPMNSFGAWVDLVLMANYKDKKVSFQSVIYTVEKGQIITSTVKLSARWNRSRKWVDRLLKDLENDAMIFRKSSNRFTMITICNYSKFQEDRDQEVATDIATADATAITTGVATAGATGVATADTQTRKKERKKGKKERKNIHTENLKNLDFGSWPVFPNPEQQKIWYQNRRNKKIPITQSIVDRHGQQLFQCKKEGYDIEKCIDVFLDNAWMAPQMKYFEGRPDLKTPKSEYDTQTEYFLEHGYEILE